MWDWGSLGGRVNFTVSSYVWYGTRWGPAMLSRALKKSQEVTLLRLRGMDSNGRFPLWGPEGFELGKVGDLVEYILGA